MLNSQPTNVKRSLALWWIFSSRKKEERVSISSPRGPSSSGGGHYGVVDLRHDGSKQARCRMLLVLLAVSLTLLALLAALPQTGGVLPGMSGNEENKNKNGNSEGTYGNLGNVPDGTDVIKEGTAVLRPNRFQNRLEALDFFIRDKDISSEDDLNEKDSYASKAIQWISEQDTVMLAIPWYILIHSEETDKAQSELLERYSLACFYYSILGDFDYNNNEGRHLQRRENEPTQEELENLSTFKSGWLSSDGVCFWHGITCNKDKQVSAIDLPGHNLRGRLPRELFTAETLPSLTSVDLVDNQQCRFG